MGTKKTRNTQGTTIAFWGLNASAIRNAVSIKRAQAAKRINRVLEWLALCIIISLRVQGRCWFEYIRRV